MDRMPRCIEPERQATRVAKRNDIGLEERVEIVGRVIASVGKDSYALENLNGESATIPTFHRIASSPMVGRPDEVLGIVHRDGAVVVGPKKVVWLHAYMIRPGFLGKLEKGPKVSIQDASYASRRDRFVGEILLDRVYFLGFNFLRKGINSSICIFRARVNSSKAKATAAASLLRLARAIFLSVIKPRAFARINCSLFIPLSRESRTAHLSDRKSHKNIRREAHIPGSILHHVP